MRIQSQQQLVDYVADDVKKNESISYPVRATYFERIFVNKLPVSWLHPNPDDEFSSKEVGASFRIVNEYRQQARDNRAEWRPYFKERIIVEKLSTGGYLIINGHHRWAAATLEGYKFVEVNIVNLTHAEDLHHMLNTSIRDKRVVMDLDEVVFSFEPDDMVDKNPSLIGGLFYKEKVKVGRIALINALHKLGYDVWVYTRGYRSTEYLNKLFKYYNVKIDGIINGIGSTNTDIHDENLRERFEKKYIVSCHIELEDVSYRDKESRQLIKKEFTCEKIDWSRSVLDIIEEIEKEL